MLKTLANIFLCDIIKASKIKLYITCKNKKIFAIIEGGENLWLRKKLKRKRQKKPLRKKRLEKKEGNSL